MPIKIPFLSDVTDFIRGTDNMADALTDVSDSLDDLATDSAKTADKAGDKLGDSFKDGAKEADKALDKVGTGMDGVGKDAKQLDNKVSAAFDNIANEAKTTGKKVEKEMKSGTDGASEGLEQMSGDAESNATEVAASFDGTADSIVEGFQGAAAEMFSGFGPAGMAAGLAVAAGIGLAMTAMDGLKEENEATTAAVGELAKEIYLAGGAIDQADLEAKLQGIFSMGAEDNKWTFWTDESETQLAKLKEGLGGANKELAAFTIKGLAGSMEDGVKATAGLTAEMEDLDKAIFAGTNTSEDGVTTYNDAAKAAQNRKNKLSELKDEVEKATGIEAEATSQAEYYTEVMGESAEATEAATDAIKKHADASAAAAGNAMDVVGAENSWVETLDQLTKDIATNGQTLDINTQAGRDNRSSLVDLADSANTYRDAAIAAGDSTASITAQAQFAREAFIAQAEAAGYNATEAANLADTYGLIPSQVETLVLANGTDEAKAAIESIPGAKETAVTTTETGSAEAQEKIDAVEGTEVEAEVKETGAAAVQKTIDNLQGRDIPITVSISNLPAIQSELNRLTAPRSLWITVNERPGVQAP